MFFGGGFPFGDFEDAYDQRSSSKEVNTTK